jgi:uncharacterized repeat protein (TIGR01451 family)
MGPGTLRHRLLVVAAALAVFASLVAISAPVASASIDISIPIDTIVKAQPGSETLLATVDSSDFAGLECTVSAVSTNQDSTHPNNDLIVASDGTSVVLEDVEAVPGATINADGVLLMGDTVTVTLLMGEDRRFSAGITVNIDCEEVLQAEVSINPNACVVNEQGVPLGSVDVAITPDSGATVTLYSDAAMQNLVGTFTGAGGSQDLSPGTYYWAAEAGTGFELAGDTSGSFTIEDCTPPLEPETDLEVTKVDLVDPVVVDTDNPTALITYEVTVTNNGPELAENVVVTDTLPASLTYVSSSPAVGSCAHAAGVVTCELGDLAVGDSALITIVVETEAVGEITDFSPLNVVEVSSDTEETNLENNVDDEETDIIEVLSLGFVHLEARGFCDNDTPYVAYSVDVSGLFPEDEPTLDLRWFDVTDVEHDPADPGVTPDPFQGIELNDDGDGNWSAAGTLLWPGARVDANGDPIDWPGWAVVDGTWTEADDGFTWAREGVYLIAEVNPTSAPTGIIYPPATPNCNPNPTVEVLDLVVLPFTGINTPFMLTGAIMLLGTGLTLVLVSRRREFEI